MTQSRHDVFRSHPEIVDIILRCFYGPKDYPRILISVMYDKARDIVRHEFNEFLEGTDILTTNNSIELFGFIDKYHISIEADPQFNMPREGFMHEEFPNKLMEIVEYTQKVDFKKTKEFMAEYTQIFLKPEISFIYLDDFLEVTNNPGITKNAAMYRRLFSKNSKIREDHYKHIIQNLRLEDENDIKRLIPIINSLSSKEALDNNDISFMIDIAANNATEEFLGIAKKYDSYDSLYKEIMPDAINVPRTKTPLGSILVDYYEDFNNNIPF